MRLAGKKAVVTGGASGFGRAIAQRFAEEGAQVAVIDLNADGARAVAAEIAAASGQGAAIAVTADVAKAADWSAARAACLDAFDAVDIVVNNAGYSHRNRPLLEVDEAEFRKVYDVNVLSIYHSVHAFLPHWRTRGAGGCMINVGSTAGIRPRPGLTWYNGSKGAVNLMSRSLAVELAPDKVRVNCLAPVMGATGLLETFMGLPDTPENRAKFIATVPLGRLSEPADMAAAATFLASDEANFVTGVVMEIDGGRTI